MGLRAAASTGGGGGGGGSGLTIGLTSITNGTSARLLWDNAGIVDETNGISWDITNKALTIGGATVTTSKPIIDGSQTWNAGAVAFTGIKFNAIDTSSAAGSLLMDLQTGGVSQFSVTKAGAATLAGALTVGGLATFSAGQNWTGLITVPGSSQIVNINSTTNLRLQGLSTVLGVHSVNNVASSYQQLDLAGSTIRFLSSASVKMTLDTNGIGIGGAGASGFALNITGASQFSSLLRITRISVASLPAAAAGNDGAIHAVSDATAVTPRTTVAGGGANKVLVQSDGSNWIILG